MKWKLVPEEPTEEMIEAAIDQPSLMIGDRYKSMLAAAPQPEQDWKGMDGAIAFHLIERHADGWQQIGAMMDAWLTANRGPDAA